MVLPVIFDPQWPLFDDDIGGWWRKIFPVKATCIINDDDVVMCYWPTYYRDDDGVMCVCEREGRHLHCCRYLIVDDDDNFVGIIAIRWYSMCDDDDDIIINACHCTTGDVPSQIDVYWYGSDDIMYSAPMMMILLFPIVDVMQYY